MAEINDESSVENLINRLSNLTVPLLLKWMIVNIPTQDLNKCLRSNVGINLSGQDADVVRGTILPQPIQPIPPHLPFAEQSAPPPGGARQVRVLLLQHRRVITHKWFMM